MVIENQVFRSIEIDAFLWCRKQGAHARRLDSLETGRFTGPVQAVAFLTRVHHVTKGQTQPVEVNLIGFRADFGKEAQEFFPLFFGDVEGLEVEFIVHIDSIHLANIWIIGVRPVT